jgi:DNA adenine methylase
MMPPHRVFIEAFLGDGAVIRHKRPAPFNNIGIELDADVVARWHAERIPHLAVCHADAIEWLSEMQEKEDWLVYCDPPYLESTRRGHRRIYRCELLSEAEHIRLLDVLLKLRCMVMVSGYDSPLYNRKLKGWRREQFYAMTRGGVRALETVWLNFPEPIELHDYSFIGRSFRERERIKRKKERWKAKLLRMQPQERHAILSAIEELRELPSS